MKRLLFYILFLFLLSSACQDKKKEQFARLVQEWQGKEMSSRRIWSLPALSQIR